MLQSPKYIQHSTFRVHITNHKFKRQVSYFMSFLLPSAARKGLYRSKLLWYKGHFLIPNSTLTLTPPFLVFR